MTAPTGPEAGGAPPPAPAVPDASSTIRDAGAGGRPPVPPLRQSFPSLNVGPYTVIVILQGFKTFIANDVALTSGAPASIKAILEIGALEEQVLVSSTSEIVQTQSTVISSTINTNQIVKPPITSRSAMDFVRLLPGVTTPAGTVSRRSTGCRAE